MVSQTIAIELGLIAAVASAGAAVQLRLFEVLRVRLRELTEEHRRRDAELEAQATERFKDVEAAREEWEKKHGHAREDSADDGKSGGAAGSLSAAPLLLASDGAQTPSEGPGTPATGGRPVSSLFNLAGTGTRAPLQPLDRQPQSPGALPALDLGNTVKDELPQDLIDRSTMIDDHPEIRERQQLVDEIRQIRRSLDTLGSHPRTTRTGRHSFGDLERTTAVEAVAKTGSPSAGRRSDPLGGRDRVQSMILLPTARPASTAFAPGPGATTSPTPSSTRPPSAPLADDDWDTYVRERKLFQPPSGVSPPIQTSDVPDALLANAGINRQRSSRSPPSEAVLSALAQRQRRETLFDPPSLRTHHEPGDKSSGTGTSTGSGKGAAVSGGPQSWTSHEAPAVPAVAARGPSPPGRRPSVDLVRAPSLSTGAALHTQPHASITVLPPARAAPQQPHTQPQPPSQPAERVLTFEEYSERHKARMRALQEPLTRQENKEATLADARARWEHSKTVESRVMARKQAEEAVQADARLRAEREAEKGERRRSRQDSKGTGVKGPGGPERALSLGGPGSPSSPAREHRRNSLSLDKLSAPRISTHVKVEEWQKYQAATAAEDAAARGAGPSPPTPPSSPRRGHHRRNSSRRDL